MTWHTPLNLGGRPAGRTRHDSVITTDISACSLEADRRSRAASSVNAERQQNVASRGPAADGVARSDKDHAPRDDSARDADGAAMGGDFVHGLELLSRVEFPKQSAVAGGYGVELSIRRPLEHHSRDGGRRGTQRAAPTSTGRRRWRKEPDPFTGPLSNGCQPGPAETLVGKLIVGPAAPHDAAPTTAAAVDRCARGVDAVEKGAVVVGIQRKDVGAFRSGKQHAFAVGQSLQNR